LLWQRQVGLAGLSPGIGADGDASGDVGGGDLTVWKEHFGEPGEGAAAATVLTSAVKAASAAATVAEVEVPSTSDAAAFDALYAVGDFTTLFAEVRSRGWRQRLPGWRGR
jgi:hypothetical protein